MIVWPLALDELYGSRHVAERPTTTMMVLSILVLVLMGVWVDWAAAMLAAVWHPIASNLDSR